MRHPELPSDLSEIFAHLRTAYPREGCGLIFRLGCGGFRQVPMDNVYDKYHRLDPQRFPRDSHSAYKLDELKVHRLIEEVEAQGGALACIVHSHCDVGAYFSEEDRAVAAPDGRPLWPGVAYLVVAVDQAEVTAAKLFWWNGDGFAMAPVGI